MSAAFPLAGMLTGQMAVVLIGWYGVASMVTFALYAIDKSAARQRLRRIPERSLHLCSVLGGWPGAIAAQSILRHKSRKQPFRIVFWCTILLNGGVLAGALFLYRWQAGVFLH